MDPISNVDAIVLVLRQRLLEQARLRGASYKSSAQDVSERAPARPDPLQALAAIEGLDDRQLGRALVQSVLAEQFGKRMVNEPQFQQVVEKVAETMQGEPEAAKLLQRIVRELRSSAR